MRKSLVSILSFVMACVMLGTSFPFTAFATEKGDTAPSSGKASVKGDNYSIESSSSFGDIISDALNKYKDSDENENFSVTDVITNNETNTISASVNAKEACCINVGVYEEKTNDLIYSSVDNVEPGQSTVNVKSEEDLPDNYVVKAVLTDDSSEPISKVYTDNDNTTWYQDYCETSVEDFEDDRVVNLDDDEDDNFMVFKDDVSIIDDNAVKEVKDNQYVLSATSETAKISEGKVFAYNVLEPEEMVVKKVASKKVEGDNIVLTVEQATMEDSFSLVKIHCFEDNVFENPDTHVEGGNIEDSVESSNLENTDKFVASTSSVEAESSIASAKSANTKKINYKTTKSASFSVEAGKVSGKLSFTTGVTFKLEYSVKNFFIDVSLVFPISTTISISVNGKINKDIFLGKIIIPITAVSINLGVYATVEGSITTTFTVKTSSQLGFGYTSGNGVKNRCKAPSVDASVQVKGSIFAGIKLKPSVSITGNIFEFSLEGKAGGVIEAAVNKQLLGSDSKHDCGPDCIDGSIGYKFGLKVTAEFLYFKLLDKCVAQIEKKGVWKFYYSSKYRDFGWGECEHKSYKTTVKVVDSNKNIIKNATVDGKATSNGSVKLWYSRGKNRITVKAAGFKTKYYNVGITKSSTVTVKMKKGSSNETDEETDSSYTSYSRNKRYSSYYTGGYGNYSNYVAPLTYTEPREGVVLSTALAGQRRSDVAWVQRELKNLGYDIEPDGYYGYKTAEIVKKFQLDYDLPVTGKVNANVVAVLKKPLKRVLPPTLRLTTPSTVASGDIATVQWENVSGAESYDIYLFNERNEMINNAVGTKANVASFVLYEPGTYTIRALSKNERFTSGESSLATVITVRDKMTVSFVDYDDTLLSKQFVDYGKSATAPASPERDGYTFDKWDKSYSQVTENNLVVKATYKPNQYTVKFLDVEGKEIVSDKYYYGTAAEAPSEDKMNIPNGYKFVGWNKDFSNITSDLAVKPVIQYLNDDLPIIIDDYNVTKDEDYGYDVTVKVRNYDKKRTTGRVVVALKTSSEKFLTMSESSAFTLAKSNYAENKVSEETIEIFVPSSDNVYYIDIFVVSAYETLIPISETVRVDAGQNYIWSEWSLTKPDVDEELIQSKTQYRYQVKELNTSNSKTLDGWTWDETKTEKPGPWSTPSTTKVSEYENEAGRREVQTGSKKVDHSEFQGYLYYHYFGYSGGNRDWMPYDAGGYSYHDNSTCLFSGQLPARWQGSSALWYGYLNTSAYACPYCGASGMWLPKGAQYKKWTTTETTYSYRDISYLYNFYRWTDWSDWSDDKVTAGSDRNVETQVLYRHRMSTDDAQDDSGVARTKSGTLDASFAGKQATLYVYKLDGSSDYTNEYVGQTVIAEDGSYSFDYKLREEPSERTGDYYMVLGIEGADGFIYLDTIEAPKPSYTVTIKDYDGSIISTQFVKQGDSAQLPAEPLEREGYSFAGWNYSNTGIYEDLIISAIYVPKTYTVVFIDWTNKRFDMDTYKYGETLIAPDLSTLDDYTAIGWENYVEGTKVTENMVITAKYEKKTFNVKFYDYNNNVINEQVVAYGESATIPELDSDDLHNFYQWNTEDLSHITSALDIRPEFSFVFDTSTPTANLQGDIYSDTVNLELNCEDENATIYYSVNSGEFTEYSEPIVIDSTSEVEYYASSSGKNKSSVQSGYYVINRHGDEANWKFPVTVNLGSGTVATYLVPVGESISDSTVPISKEGYQIEGFYFDADFSETIDEDYAVDSSLEIYVKYKPIQYTVNFRNADGTIINTQTVDYLESATAPTDFEVEDGYIFEDWNTIEYLCVTSDLDVMAVLKAEDELDAINLNRSAYTMMEGYSYSLIAKTQGDDLSEIIWTSDDESVATVDENGKVVAVNEGIAVISANIYNSGISASCYVTVVANPKNSVKLSEDSHYYVEDGCICGVSPRNNAVGTLTEEIESENIKVYKGETELLQTDSLSTGCIVKLYDSEGNTIDEKEIVVTGDVNGDGELSTADVSHVARFLLQKEELTGVYLKAADVNLDGVVNNKDASYLLRVLADKESI